MKQKLENPNRTAGGYTLHLYCDHDNDEHEWDEFPHIYLNELGSKCRSAARRDGWVIRRDGTATCPKCNR